MTHASRVSVLWGTAILTATMHCKTCRRQESARGRGSTMGRRLARLVSSVRALVLAAALARGEHRGAAIPPRRYRPDDQLLRHRPVIFPSRVSGRQSRGGHRAEPPVAQPGLLLRCEQLQRTLSPARWGAIPARFVAESSAGHCAAFGAATLWDRAGARHPPNRSRLRGRLSNRHACGGRVARGLDNRRYGKQWIDARPTDRVISLSRSPSAQQAGSVTRYRD